MKVALLTLAALSIVTSQASADGLPKGCGNYKAKEKISVIRGQLSGSEQAVIKAAALQHLQCAVAADNALQSLRGTLKADAIENAGGYSGTIKAATSRIKSSWISEGGMQNGRSGEYVVEALEAVETNGVGTGLFGGVVDNIRTVMTVQISGVIDNKASRSSLQIKIDKVTSDLKEDHR